MPDQKLPKSCRHALRYKAVRKPACSGGTGCESCWKIWNAKQTKVMKAAEQARKLKEKLESDFEQLPTNYLMPGKVWAGGTSWGKGSDAEKKQEYNKRMGYTADFLRGSVLGHFPKGLDQADISKYLSNLAEDERRFTNRRRARSVSIAAARDVLFLREFEMMADRFLKSRIEPSGYALKSIPHDFDRTLFTHLSDLHIRAMLDPKEGLEPFGPEEEARRLAWVILQTAEWKTQYRNKTKLNLLLNGDVIEGLLLHDIRDGAPLAEQCVAFLHLMARALAFLAKHFPQVDVWCQTGNHGRNKLRHEGRATSSKWDSYETILYKSLEAMSCDLKNVFWHIPKTPFNVIPVYNKHVLQVHGDTEPKLADPDTKAHVIEEELNKLNANLTYGVHIDLLTFGHFHKGRILTFRHADVLVNGALVPPNGHARASGYTSTACGQYLWEAVPDFALGDSRFVRVGPSQDKNADLDKVIKPFFWD